jgi:hypothetical protein
MAAIFIFNAGKAVLQIAPYQVRGRLHPDADKLPARHKAARTHAVVKNAHHRTEQSLQNSS